jgi:hypothetical protein
MVQRAQLALTQLGTFISKSPDSARLNPRFQRAVFFMMMGNIFRDSGPPLIATRTMDFTVSVGDPVWPQRELVYAILIPFIHLFADAEFVSLHTMVRFMALTETAADSRERTAIASVLQAFYTVRLDERTAFIRALLFKLMDVRAGVMLPWAGCPLLLCARHVLSTSAESLPGPVRELVLQGIIPLVRFPLMPVIEFDLKVALSDIFTLLPESAMDVLKELQRSWPLTGQFRAKFVADLVVDAATRIHPSVFAKIESTFFRFVAGYIRSPNLMFSMTILDALIRTKGSPFMQKNGNIMIENLRSALNETAESHWSYDARMKAAMLFDILTKQSRAELSRRPKTSERTDLRRENTWKYVTKAAQLEEGLETKLIEIERLTRLEGPMTHFLPRPRLPTEPEL